MKLSDVKFYKSVSLGSDAVYFDNHPEIIFVGRSNVGKSSIMNALFEKKDLVKTSSRPGKTKTANLFVVANKFYFTDLPGYGFARLGKEVRDGLDGLISWYVEERRENIKQVVMLIDSKIGPQETDIDMYKYLLELGMPLLVVLSKIDRLSTSDIQKSIAHTEKEFFGQKILAVSSTKKTGINELAKILKDSLLV